MSIPAHAPGDTRTHRHQSDGAKAPRPAIDPARIAALGATNKALSDLEARVYVTLALAFPNTEVDVDTLANLLPHTAQQIRNALGYLVGHGLLDRRQRIVGYNEKSLRIRRYFYRLAVVA